VQGCGDSKAIENALRKAADAAQQSVNSSDPALNTGLGLTLGDD
jgi:hypothetical protein